MFWSPWMLRDWYLSNYATDWMKTKLIRKIRSKLYSLGIVKNPSRRFVSESFQPKVYILGSLSLSKNYFWSSWRRDATASPDDISGEMGATRTTGWCDDPAGIPSNVLEFRSCYCCWWSPEVSLDVLLKPRASHLRRGCSLLRSSRELET